MGVKNIISGIFLIVSIIHSSFKFTTWIFPESESFNQIMITIFLFMLFFFLIVQIFFQVINRLKEENRSMALKMIHGIGLLLTSIIMYFLTFEQGYPLVGITYTIMLGLMTIIARWS